MKNVTSPAWLCLLAFLLSLWPVSSPAELASATATPPPASGGQVSGPCANSYNDPSLSYCLNEQGKCLRSRWAITQMISSCDRGCNKCPKPVTLKGLNPGVQNLNAVFLDALGNQILLTAETMAAMVTDLIANGAKCVMLRNTPQKCREVLQNGAILTLSFIYPPAGVAWVTANVIIGSAQCGLSSFSSDPQFAALASQYCANLAATGGLTLTFMYGGKAYQAWRKGSQPPPQPDNTIPSQVQNGSYTPPTEGPPGPGSPWYAYGGSPGGSAGRLGGGSSLPLPPGEGSPVTGGSGGGAAVLVQPAPPIVASGTGGTGPAGGAAATATTPVCTAGAVAAACACVPPIGTGGGGAGAGGGGAPWPPDPNLPPFDDTCFDIANQISQQLTQLVNEINTKGTNHSLFAGMNPADAASLLAKILDIFNKGKAIGVYQGSDGNYYWSPSIISKAGGASDLIGFYQLLGTRLPPAPGGNSLTLVPVNWVPPGTPVNGAGGFPGRWTCAAIRVWMWMSAKGLWPAQGGAEVWWIGLNKKGNPLPGYRGAPLVGDQETDGSMVNCPSCIANVPPLPPPLPPGPQPPLANPGQ